MMQRKPLLKGTFLFSAWGISFALLYVDGLWTNTFDNSVKPTTFFYALATFALLFFITHVVSVRKDGHSKKKAMQMIEWLASHSFLLYLIHPLILTMLVLISEKAGQASFWIGTDRVIYLYVTTVVCSYVAIAICNRLPFAPWFGGVRKK